MNWFQKLWNNGNFHAVVATAAGAASLALPQYSVPLQILAGTFAAPALALPGGSILGNAPAAPVAPAPVVTLPAAAAGGSYHAVDYANLAAALLAQFAKPEQPGRS